MKSHKINKVAIPTELINMLVCPVDKAKVELTADGNGLKCAECHRIYPIREDIPVMLPEEATTEDIVTDTSQSA